ncbi:hypothetical protein ACFY7H_13235 [Streptomyces sp. NPDC012794]|uniref:hypothetical protein n=1 Tax=Streptomyces sp. NPDC012794 TaxID=3364850 RepID=UPI0036951EB2
MGYELRRKLRVALGPNITGLQRAVALEITDDANDQTRESYVGLDELALWTGAKDEGVVRNALKRLSAAGWEFRVPIGKGKDGRLLYAVPGRRMTFKVPLFEGVAVAPPRSEGGAVAPSEGALAPPRESEGSPSSPEGGAGAPSEGAGAPCEGAVAPPFPSSPHSPQEEEEASSSRVTEHLEAFGAFWLNYPKKIDRGRAKTEWVAAMHRGADPAQIVDKAQAYARQQVDTEPRFIAFAANWLRNERYFDEYPETDGRPGLRAVPGTAHSRQQQDTDDLFDRAMQRAKARMQQQEIS